MTNDYEPHALRTNHYYVCSAQSLSCGYAVCMRLMCCTLQVSAESIRINCFIVLHALSLNETRRNE